MVSRMFVRYVLVVVAVAALVVPGVALADELNIDNLPKDPKAYRASVEKILKQVDSLVDQLKDKPEALRAVQDLQMTRDNVMREIVKIEAQPDGSKWTAAQMRVSVDLMLALLQKQYEKAQEVAG